MKIRPSPATIPHKQSAPDEQARLDDAYTADFTVVRAMLRKGRAYK